MTDEAKALVEQTINVARKIVEEEYLQLMAEMTQRHMEAALKARNEQNAVIEALEAEVERLREALRDIADERGECGTCGTLAVGGGGGITSCDCNYSYWVPRDAQTAARAALGEKQ